MKVDFKEIIHKMKVITGLKQKEIAAQLFNISDKNLSNKIKRNSVEFFAIIEWASKNNVDLNWLFLDKQTKPQNLNDDLLLNVITAVEEKLTKEKKTLNPDKKAQLVSTLYDYFIETDQQVEPKAIESHLKLVVNQ